MYKRQPHVEVYEKFRDKYYKLNRRYGKDQYLVPYLISSHPGCTLEDAVQLAEWLNKEGHMPEQVQDFYPCLLYTSFACADGYRSMASARLSTAWFTRLAAMRAARLSWR